MLFAESLAITDAPVADRLRLPYDARCRSRQKVTLLSGEELLYVLRAGTILRHGDRLLTDSGQAVVVEAASESLLEVRAQDPLHLLRAAYHLGNRHVPLQLDAQFLRFPRDHVLAEMLHGLGCTVAEIEAPFDPDGGAYRAHAAPGHAPAHAHPAHAGAARIHQFGSQ